MNDERCETCRYFHVAYGSEWTRSMITFGIVRSRECRQSSPSVGQHPWPQVKKDDWCGQWERKSDE